MKPAFIPLKGVYFDKIKAGLKDCEYRKHGGRWAPKNFPLGHPCTLSRGYGKQDRIIRTVKAVRVVNSADLPEDARTDVRDCYGQDVDVLEITFDKERN